MKKKIVIGIIAGVLLLMFFISYQQDQEKKIRLLAEAKAANAQLEQLQTQRNELTKDIAEQEAYQAKMKKLKEELAQNEAEGRQLREAANK